MRNSKTWAAGWLLLTLGFLGRTLAADELYASSPQSVTLSIYDTGFSLVNELRRITLNQGQNTVRFTGLPSQLDPSSVSFSPVAGRKALEVLDQHFAYDLQGPEYLFRRYKGRKIWIEHSQGRSEGILLKGPDPHALQVNVNPIVIQIQDGSAIAFVNPNDSHRVVFPGADKNVFLEPTLIWRVNALQDGPQNLRLNYVTGGISWKISYEGFMKEDGTLGLLLGRVGIFNHSGGNYKKARVRLVLTEMGALPALVPQTGFGNRPTSTAEPSQRYSYGQPKPAYEQTVAGSGRLKTYDLPNPVNLNISDTKYVEMFSISEGLTVERFYVYDGVKFDRFQRNTRTDWNYGTESHNAIETHFAFDVVPDMGLGNTLPSGRFRLYQELKDGSVDLLGADYLHHASEDQKAIVRLGPARGLKGERERTVYRESTPLHEYEESFEIRLENESAEEVEIRVVEHLYRWPDYKVVKADMAYKELSPGIIEFRPLLKPGGRRSVHYTVRYSW